MFGTVEIAVIPSQQAEINFVETVARFVTFFRIVHRPAGVFRNLRVFDVPRGAFDFAVIFATEKREKGGEGYELEWGDNVFCL